MRSYCLHHRSVAGWFRDRYREHSTNFRSPLASWSRGASYGAAAVGILLIASLVSPEAALGQATEAPPAAEPQELTLERLPEVDLSALESTVAEQLRTARRIFEAQLAKGPESASALAEDFGGLGRIYHAYELVVPAAVCYRNAARLAPQDFRWHYYLGDVQRMAQELETAADHYASAVRFEPSYLPSYVGFADALREMGHAAEAEVILRRALEVDDTAPSVIARLGEVALDQGRPQEAVEQLTEALRRLPEANRLHYPLALAYRALGDLEAARRHLELRGDVGVKPSDPLLDTVARQRQGERVYILEGRMAYNAGRFVEAETAFRRAVEAAPENAGALVNLASAIGAQGRSEDALAIYQQAMDLEPDNHTAAYNVGVLAAGLGRLEPAEAAFRKVLEHSPTDLDSIGYLGRILEAMNRREDALAVFVEAREILPEAELVRFQQARLLVDLGRYGEALEQLEATYAEMPAPKVRTSARIVHALARLLAASPVAAQRDGARALPLAVEVFEAEPTAGHAITVAMAHAQLDACAEAAAWQGRAIDAVAEGDPGLAAAWRVDLQRYGAGSPCRPPAASVP